MRRGRWGLLAILGAALLGVCAILAAVQAALEPLRAQTRRANFQSALRANYSADEEGGGVLQPLSGGIFQQLRADADARQRAAYHFPSRVIVATPASNIPSGSNVTATPRNSAPATTNPVLVFTATSDITVAATTTPTFKPTREFEPTETRATNTATPTRRIETSTRQPSATPQSTVAATASPQSTTVVIASPQVTASPTLKPTLTETLPATSTPTERPTLTTTRERPTLTPLPSYTPSPVPTVPVEPTALPTKTPLPTLTPLPTKTPLPTFTPAPIKTPTHEPTHPATLAPSETPKPTRTPTNEPTQPATAVPTETRKPTKTPTDEPTDAPTDKPTDEPTDKPTEEPTATKTPKPTKTPKDEPTQNLTPIAGWVAQTPSAPAAPKLAVSRRAPFLFGGNEFALWFAIVCAASIPALVAYRRRAQPNFSKMY